jgi:hypothetical protein
MRGECVGLLDPNAGIHVVDVASWMCTPACLIYEREVLYRDSNHLSAFGATRLAGQLQALLEDRRVAGPHPP